MSNHKPSRIGFTLLLAVLPGCLTNQYAIPRQELVRIARLPADRRADSVRVIENVGMPPAPQSGVGIDARTNIHYSSSTSGGGKSSKGGATAVLAAVVVAGAAVGVALALSEGLRYDGWARLAPKETIRLNTGPVRLSELTPELAARSNGGTVNGGPDLVLLRRAPLDRRGVTWTTATHSTGIPTMRGATALGVGGATQLGANIGNILTLGFGAYIDSSVYGPRAVLASCGPEIHLFPAKYVGVYAGLGWLFRDSVKGSTSFTDAGSIYRGGLLAEVPLTTRLALQFRGGAFMSVLDETRFSGEALFGLAIY